MSKEFTIFWRTGDAQIVKGEKASEAMNNAGIGAGALAAMDFYAEGDQRNKWEYNKEERNWSKKKKGKKK